MKKRWWVIPVGAVAIWGFQHWSGSGKSAVSGSRFEQNRASAPAAQSGGAPTAAIPPGARPANPLAQRPNGPVGKPFDLAAARAKDLAALEQNEAGKEPELISALLRLSTQRDPAAQRKALELVTSKDNRVRMIAIRALGYFDDEHSNHRLQELLHDQDLTTRRSALQALSFGGTNSGSPSGREQILKDFLSASSKKPEPGMLEPDRLMAMSALYRYSSRDDEKSDYLEKMLDIAKNSKREPIRRLAVQSLKGIAPQDKRVQELSVRQ